LTDPLKVRRAGVLLHPTSLPGDSWQGQLGSTARVFVDFLHSAGFSVWQMLPLGPTHEDRSPYQCLSVHAGNVELISMEDVAACGWLDPALLPDTFDTASHTALLQQARSGFEATASDEQQAALAAFREGHADWLEDYALYQAIRQVHDHASWLQWPTALRDREAAALADFRLQHAGLIDQACFEQYLFFTQWQALRDYAHARQVLLFGDIPIFVAHDSADVWAHRNLFSVDASGMLEVVAGVPPDYFSATGQRWGNPLYHWDSMQAEDFEWWIQRFRTQLALFDIVRLDHFRGFEKYWEIPAAAETAIDGHWVEAPGAALFTRLQQVFGELPLVAEDLGLITPEVDALREAFGMPGMKILQFAFDSGPDNPYLPHNHVAASVVYTGTHDNDTTLGWFQALDADRREAVLDYLGYPSEPMPWPLIRAALASVAGLAIMPVQDLLELGSEQRMNTPGVPGDNWSWRIAAEQLPDGLAARLRQLVEMYGRGVRQ
jgi:4-alpha-glucanotransferase